ncbi:MAG: molecular chaperone HtpG [Bacteroidaceae bacterium]|nr:molecular chaperone HtpG [Bacteroidaceae bacterium]
MQKGNIGVTTENIFPVIKKFLYSDHEIFLREIISNAVDATQKLKTLQSQGEFTEDPGDLTIRVSLDPKKKTLTVSDRGIGMTAEEIDKYINQIAFSGASDFLEKFKDNANAIIGHFGLGFYSSFMVSKKVEIISLSYKEGSKAVKWSCDGTPEYSMEECKKADRGTDIVMHIDDECKEYLEKYKIEQLLKKYCRFLPVSIAFGKKTEWKEGKEKETAEDNIINDTDPIWRRKPADLKDEDYQKFYHALYPGYEEPLFWIHLNVDYPFNLTGVLFFPKIKNDLDLRRNKIQLYCNQVFVTDSVENIVPDFLTLLHGVIDSPDIPLNVSRSYLQSDANVKKISKYITKKVSDRLESIFKEDRKTYEQKWDDLKLFIHYGLLSEPDFWDKGSKVMLLKDTEGKYYTLDEYKELIKDNQTDKNKTLVYLYATDATQQYTYIQNAKEKGYSVLLMDGQLDIPLVGMLEQKGQEGKEQCRFSRVDSDTVSRLIPKEEDAQEVLDADESANLSACFKSQMPEVEKAEFSVEVQPMGADEAPVVITQSEYMRRMKEMSKLQAGMSFYGEMPDMYTLILNSDHPAVSKLNTALKEQTAEAIKPIEAELKGLRARQAALRDEQQKDKDKFPEEQKKDLEQTDTDIKAQEDKKQTLLADFAKGEDKVRHLIDLALLQNGMLRGEALNNFVKRSINLIK